MSRSGEFEWIERYLAPLAGEGAFGLRDDAAIVSTQEGHDLVVTQDAVLEGVHFFREDPPDLVARKALRVNISDVVAKGAAPMAYSIALGVPDRWQDEDMARFALGLSVDQEAYGIELTGGDTFRSSERLCISVTLFGNVAKNRYKSRLGAQSGDVLLVSGTIGDAALGLKVAMSQLEVDHQSGLALLNAYRLPDPPVALAAIIAEHASAAMDVSDGLLGDCAKLCRASGVSAVIEQQEIPLSAAAKKVVSDDPGLWDSVVGGGDDYQVLMTARSASAAQAIAEAAELGIALAEIGKIAQEVSGNVLLTRDGVPVSTPATSFSHF